MLKWLLRGLVLILLVVVGLYGWFIYAPDIEMPELRGELRWAQLDVDGLQREYQYYYSDPAPGAAIVFALHGSTGSPDRARRGYAYRFDVLADQGGMIPVYPLGFDNHWNDCRAAADYQANVQDIDDIAFFRAMVDDLVARHQADRNRVYVTGISNGGHLAYKLALEAPDLVAAVAPVAAGLPVWEESDCTPSGESVPIAIMNGTEDPVNPFEGGVVNLFGNTSRGRVMSSRATAEYFAQLAGHVRPAATVELADFNPADNSVVELTAWQSPGLDEVRHYKVIGGGHNVPMKNSRTPRIIGPTNRDINGADQIWSFFLATEAP